MKPKSSLTCSPEPATRPYPEPDESRAHPQTLFKICFNVVVFWNMTPYGDVVGYQR